MKIFLKKSAIMALLTLIIVPLVMIRMGHAGGAFSLPTLPTITFSSNVKNNLETLLPSLFTLSKNTPGTPGEIAPPAGSVAPNFSDLVTGSTEITENGSFVVKTDSDMAFGINQTNSDGYAFLSKSTDSAGIGLESVATQTGISATGADIGAYGEGLGFGMSIEGKTQIGIKAESSNIGSYLAGETGISVNSGTKYGILGIGKDAGIIGYIDANTWGALGYNDGTTLYGLYTPSVTKIGGVLTSDGIIDVEGTATLSDDTVVSDTANINTLNTRTWESSSGNISWDANTVVVTGDLESSADLFINTEKTGNDFVIENGGLILSGGQLQGNQPFQINSDLQVTSGNLYSTGKITADGKIGSFYYRESASATQTSNSATCESGWLVGCSGQIISGDGILISAVPDATQKTCKVSAENGTSVRAYAYCFDPTTVSKNSLAVSVLSDSDEDDWTDFQDNCPTTANSDQNDSDGDGVGDACEADTTPPNNGRLDTIEYVEPSYAYIAWSGFFDDVGIVNYILADSFTDYPSTCSGTSVGNVRGYNYGLNGNENNYYFRLCAVDSAGNKSEGIVFSLGVTRDPSNPTGSPTGAPDIGYPR